MTVGTGKRVSGKSQVPLRLPGALSTAGIWANRESSCSNLLPSFCHGSIAGGRDADHKGLVETRPALAEGIAEAKLPFL